MATDRQQSAYSVASEKNYKLNIQIGYCDTNGDCYSCANSVIRWFLRPLLTLLDRIVIVWLQFECSAPYLTYRF